MTRLVDEVIGQLRAEAQVDPSSLALRVDALGRFRRATEPYLPADWLEPVRAVAARAGQRLALSRTHTVTALAGGSGSGKSSLFNALAGMELSPVGLRRPTTGQAYACVWGEPAEAGPTLDWLRVPVANRFARESALDADDQASLRGLVLLDLPDFDSVEADHAAEVSQLLELVDLVVWVVDPQKYADRVLHERYLRRFHRHRAVTLVALNQTDLLEAADVPRLLADLDQLLATDGLADVPTLATSAVIGAAGLTGLRAALQTLVTGRRAALHRLAADVDEVVDGLVDLIGPEPVPLTVDRVPELVSGLAEAAGLPATTRAAESAYRARVAAAMSGPLSWRVRRKPADPPPATAAGTVGRAAAGLAVRTVAARASAGLPAPWPDAIADASRSHLDDLPEAVADALADALATGDTSTGPGAPGWCRLVSAAHWLAAGTALVGLGWLVIGWVLAAVAVPVSHSRVGAVPVPVLLLTGGLLGALALATLAQSLARWAARRARARTAGRLRAALAEIADRLVVEPIREVLRRYAEARAALHLAGATPPPRHPAAAPPHPQ
ncbi:MAG: ABC transporter [Micromonosporaceae bacterium]|nr:ABC transporter [Micromonosporaceae bacterium]